MKWRKDEGTSLDRSSLPEISAHIYKRHSVPPWAVPMTVRFGSHLVEQEASWPHTTSQNHRTVIEHSVPMKAVWGLSSPSSRFWQRYGAIQDPHHSRKGTPAWGALRGWCYVLKKTAFSQQLLGHQLVLHHPLLSNQIRSLQKTSFITHALMYLYTRAYIKGCQAGLIRQAAVLISIPRWPFACHRLKSKELVSFIISF